MASQDCEEQVDRPRCDVCFEYFTSENPQKNALILPCGHTFCLECLSGMKADDDTIKCPVRCTPTANVGTLASLPRNRMVEGAGFPDSKKREHVADTEKQDAMTMAADEGETIMCGNECGHSATLHCKTCKAPYCNACNEAIHCRAILQRHERGPIRERPLLCLEHAEPLELYCKQDKMLICLHCLKPGSCHSEHATAHVERVALVQREAIGTRNQAFLKQEQHFMAQLEAVTRDMEVVTTQAQAARDRAAQLVLGLHLAVDRLGARMLQDVAQEEARLADVLGKKLEEIKAALEQVRAGLAEAECARQASSVALVARKTAQRVQAMAVRAQKLDIELHLPPHLGLVDPLVVQVMETLDGLRDKEASFAQPMANAFAPLVLDAARKAPILVLSPDTPLTITATRPEEPNDIWEMVVGKRGVVVKGAVGLSWVQLKVHTLPHPWSARIGLLLGTEHEVRDDDWLGNNRFPGVGWRTGTRGTGFEFYHLPRLEFGDDSPIAQQESADGSHEEELGILFGEGDCVTLVLDYRARPGRLRLLVNGQARKEIVLPALLDALPDCTLYPAIAVGGYWALSDQQQTRVVLEEAPLPPALEQLVGGVEI